MIEICCHVDSIRVRMFLVQILNIYIGIQEKREGPIFCYINEGNFHLVMNIKTSH